jgi:uncharacterized protein (UPF0332 family)
MSFAWQEYLVLAEALVQARTTFAAEEACCRAAISRAYYAVYGLARAYARDHEGLRLPATGEAHHLVIAHYRQGAYPLHRVISDSLRQLRSLRNLADYADEIHHPVELAMRAVRRARQVMTQLQALAATPPSSRRTTP